MAVEKKEIHRGGRVRIEETTRGGGGEGDPSLCGSLSVCREEQEAGPLGRRSLRQNNPRLLRKLLSQCFAKFHSVVQAHAVLLSHLHRAKIVFNGEPP